MAANHEEKHWATQAWGCTVLTIFVIRPGALGADLGLTAAYW